MRISDWSSDVCSSDLAGNPRIHRVHDTPAMRQTMIDPSKTASRRDILIGTAATLAVGLPALSLTSGAAAAADCTPTTQKGSVTMSSYITTKDGTEIFYKDWGPKSAQPIVFHRGWPLSADDWDAQMMFFLEKGYRVIAHDRRGHGRSTQTYTGNEMDTYAADMIELAHRRSEEHTSELQSLMRISYAVFCLKKKTTTTTKKTFFQTQIIIHSLTHTKQKQNLQRYF